LGDAASVTSYNTFFADPAVTVLAITATVWERAARIRSAHGFKALDSLHLAAAVENGCRAFLTNDTLLARFPDITVEVLS
jgi:predicted nucleic acid-binding protein